VILGISLMQRSSCSATQPASSRAKFWLSMALRSTLEDPFCHIRRASLIQRRPTILLRQGCRLRAVLASLVSRLYYLSFDNPRRGQRDRDDRMGNLKSDCTTRGLQGCIYSRQNLIPMRSPVQYLDLIAERGSFNADGASTTFRLDTSHRQQTCT